MSLKRTEMSMPMSSAGIIGLSSTTDLGGISLDPKSFVIAITAIVMAIHIAKYFI